MAYVLPVTRAVTHGAISHEASSELDSVVITSVQELMDGRLPQDCPENWIYPRCEKQNLTDVADLITLTQQ